MDRDELSRRDFLKATSGVAVAAGLTTAGEAKAAPRARKKTVGPADKIRVGIVGLAGRGYGYHMATLAQHADVEVGAVCDVHQMFVDRAVNKLGGKPKAYNDFRKLLEQKDIDAVVVATPPHWHSLVAINAILAGKDVLCEKPMSRTPGEAHTMMMAAQKYKKVTHVGTQIHATPNYHKCVNIVRSGILGQITAIRNFCTMNDNSEGLGTPPDSDPLPGLNWDMWLGPAPKVPFNIGRFRDGMHRYFADYVDSWLHELGPHIVDLPVWAANLGQPLSVSATGGRYATTSIATVPDTLDVTWEYPGLVMSWTMSQANSFPFGVGKPGPGRRLGIIFQGTKGTLLANYGVCEVYDNDGKLVESPKFSEVSKPPASHEREFLDAIKNRSEPSCSFTNHYPLHLALNLAHVSLKVGRKISWNADKFQCNNDREATQLLMPQYRAPWKLPKI